ncbi:MAG: HAD family hydrolase [Candidatus Binatia bacterium]|jgi:FMN phosphatase YigB (HAD superfamily)
MRDWTKIHAVIFDVDGTLYDQRKLRLLMGKDLLLHAVWQQRGLRELMIIRAFRQERTRHRHDVVEDLNAEQYRWAARRCGVSEQLVRSVVTEWIYSRPLRYLAACKRRGLDQCLSLFESRRTLTAVFSDYPATEKIAALGLPISTCAAATDGTINRLKPDPRGLHVVCEALETPARSCLYIGNDEELDAACAHRAGMQSLILGSGTNHQLEYFRSFTELATELRQAS